MKPLVECVHPDLPGRVVLMPGGPRNGWRRADAKPAKKKTTPKKTTRQHGAGGEDSPTAGQSTTITKDEE